MTPLPIDAVAETVNDESPYVLTSEVDPNEIVREIEPGAIVVVVVETEVLEGESTIGGAGGATTDVDVDDSPPAIVVVVVPVGAEPRTGSTSTGNLPPFAFFPLPEIMLVLDSPPRVVVVT